MEISIGFMALLSDNGPCSFQPQLIVDSAHRDSLSEPSDNVSSVEKPDIEIKIETSCDDVITTDKQELVQGMG